MNDERSKGARGLARRSALGRMAWLGALVGMGVALLAGPTVADEPRRVSSVGRKVESLTLHDAAGRAKSLAEVRAGTVVVVFLGVDCPLAKLYAPRLVALARRYADRDVAFVAIDANVQDRLPEIAAFARRHELTFPMWKDGDQRAAEAFGAVRTPEAFVLDRDRVIRYQGRIDDQYAIGVQRTQPSREDLAAALDELLAGKPVSRPTTEAVGCVIGRSAPKASRGDITYFKHVAPILNARCVECHREGEIGPFSLARHADLEGWGATIAESVRAGRMPPWNANPEFGRFRNDARLTAEERRTLLQWIDDGMPAGDPADAPPPPKFVDGWRIPQPDVVIPIRDEPVSVPAEGAIDYRYFEVDPGFQEDKYVVAAEARPGNRAVVHHVIAYVKPPGESDFRRRGILVGYAPGADPAIYRDGAAKLVPAGSKLVFEMHYTANGSPQTDRSYIGLKFLDKAQVKSQIRNAAIVNERFVIPPGAARHVVRAEQRMPRDVNLLSLTPHMHVRGRSFRYEAQYPDGRREVLVDVPRYDFNWQLSYELAEPKLLPRGTLVTCEAEFDNSEDNPANPDPSKEVRWGDQSWEEMMIGFFEVIPVGK